MKRHFDRRTFLQTAAAGAACAAIAPYARAFDLNSKLRVAAIGTGNKGRDDLLSVAASPRVEVVALCDVDESQGHLGWAAEKFPRAERYSDYRRLLDKPDSFDAVIVATPDHMHAPIALSAMQMGKHVFCEKPLAHTVLEARRMREAAEQYGVVTQMGNQIQSHHAYRMAVQLVHDGAIGKVREVHSWAAGDMWWMTADHPPEQPDPVPPSLNWDLWLGVAPERSYNSEIYHPIRWRAWRDFSNGQLGDLGCHILDPVYLALGLTSPVSVEADAGPLGNDSWAKWSTVSYRYTGTARTAGEVLPLTWYDGKGRKPNVASLGLPEDYRLPGGGSVLVGQSGTMVLPHWSEPRLFPEQMFADYAPPVMEDVDHYTSWVDACLGDGGTTSHFGYAGPLTEAVLLGAVAIRFPGEQLQWDSQSLRIPNHDDANAYLSKEYRRGWSPIS
jgi:predicted dehydrogenase